MNKIILSLIACAMTCNLAFAEDSTPLKGHQKMEAVRAQVHAARITHRAAIEAERENFRKQINAILAGHPKALEKFKDHCDKANKGVEARKEHKRKKHQDK